MKKEYKTGLQYMLEYFGADNITALNTNKDFKQMLFNIANETPGDKYFGWFAANTGFVLITQSRRRMFKWLPAEEDYICVKDGVFYV